MADLARLEDVVRRGGTFYLTPEGRYTYRRPYAAHARRSRAAGAACNDLSLRRELRSVRFTASLDALPDRAARQRADDEEVSRYPPRGRESVARRMAARARRRTVYRARSVRRGSSTAASLPPQLFVDPELRNKPDALVRAALRLMVQWQILQRDGESYVLAPERLHPQFPFVRDIVAYQDAFLNETIENAVYATCPKRRELPELRLECNEACAHRARSGAAGPSIGTDNAMRRHEEIERTGRHR